MPAGSRSFDRAAPFYDRTRALPDTAVAHVTALLAAELIGRGRCLEIGVGTGQIALPLHEVGIRMVGVDLSRPMLGVLTEKAGAVPFPLAQADATRLPFTTDTFGAGLACHVFHLIPDWRDAVGELMRVVRPRGLVLSNRGARERETALGSVRERVRTELGADACYPGADHGQDDLDDALTQLSTVSRPLPPVPVTQTATLAALLDTIEAQRWSWTWDLPPDRLRAAVERARAWAQREYGPLETPVVVHTEVRWRAYELR